MIVSANIDLVTENSGSVAGLAYLPAGSTVVRIAAGDNYVSFYRAPQSVNIGTISAFQHKFCVLRSENGGPGTPTLRPQFTVGLLDRYAYNATTDVLADVQYCDNASITFGRMSRLLTKAVEVGSGALHLTLNGVDAIDVDNTSKEYSALVTDGVEGFETNITDDGVASFVPKGGSGILHVKVGTASSGYAVIAWRSDAQAVVISRSAVEMDVCVGEVLTGTSGADGKFTVSIATNKIYFENRTGTARSVNVKFL